MNDLTIITAVFDNVFGRTTRFTEFEDRLEIQKIVYILNELGVSCGDYSFRWYKHGPYSQLLQNTLLRDDCEDISQVEFSDAGEKALTKVKEMIKVDHDGYDDSEWLEALGSLLYLRKRSNESKETVIEDLESRKEHLKNRGLNSKAYDVLQKSGLT